MATAAFTADHRSGSEATTQANGRGGTHLIAADGASTPPTARPSISTTVWIRVNDNDDRVAGKLDPDEGDEAERMNGRTIRGNEFRQHESQLNQAING
jgi:hypothetical protein